MPLSHDRWIPLAEFAAMYGRAPKSLRRIAQEQQRAHSTRYTKRTLLKWPRFSRDPSGWWGIWESQVIAWRASQNVR